MWPDGFERVIPGEPWTEQPIEELARKYDSVENHGWYRNLEPTLMALGEALQQGDLIVDYSAGTGILVDRLFTRSPELEIDVVLVDASPKFLRVAVEKLGHDQLIAFRWIRYIREEKRLQRLDEIFPESLKVRGVDALISTNAIHLYYGMEETLRSWAQVLRPGGRVFVQSGNIANPDRPEGTWIIDQTVEQIQSLAHELVRADSRFAPFREGLDDLDRARAYDDLRGKYFLPVRPVTYYLAQLESAGFDIDDVEAIPIRAEVADWYDFLSAYHEGVLGWAGGVEKIEGRAPTDDLVALRLRLLRESLEILFDGAPGFEACWTYITCTRP